MKHLFFGGIHPKYNKEMSKTTPEVKTIAPKTVVIPMVQHIGAPCTPLGYGHIIMAARLAELR